MGTKEGQLGGSKVQSIDRAVSILEILSEYPSLSLHELSEQAELHKATTHRLVNSLVDNGFIEQMEETKQYRISLKMFELGNKRVQNIDFLNVAKSIIRQLYTEVNQTVHLVIEDSDEVLYIDKYGDQTESKMRSKIGLKAPLYCTAVGKAILATRTDEQVKQYRGKVDAKAKTSQTITSYQAFKPELEKIRIDRYAVDDEEFEYGVYCIGSVFSSFKEEVAGAISISLPTTEKNNKNYYVLKTVECAKKITSLLGGTWNS